MGEARERGGMGREGGRGGEAGDCTNIPPQVTMKS